MSGTVLSPLNIISPLNLYCSPYEVGIIDHSHYLLPSPPPPSSSPSSSSFLFLFFLRELSLREVKSRSPSWQVTEAASKPCVLILTCHQT